MPTEARDAIELLDHLGIERAMIVGTSRGGLLAMTIAVIAPGRMSAVLLNDIGPELGAEGIAGIMGHIGMRPAARTLDEAAALFAEINADRFPGLTARDWRPHVARWFREGPDGLHLRYDPRLRDALLEQAEAGPPPDLWPLFDALAPIPTGVLRGARSDILLPATVEKMMARRPDLMVAEVRRRGHVPFLDEPESLALFDRLLARAQT